MLRYLACGPRCYRLHPVPIKRRPAWEFQLVLRGQARPILADGTTPAVPAPPVLWLFPPEIRHGWTDPGKTSSVAVVHATSVAEPLAGLVMRCGGTHVKLTAADADAIAAQVDRAIRDLARPTTFTALRCQRLLADLAVVATRAFADEPIDQPGGDAHGHLADAVIAWYRQHLPSGPGVAAAARAMRCSTAHLRRVFARRGETPHGVLSRLRLERATELLVTRRACDLAWVATSCGFANASSFSRWFAAATGCTPGSWRNASRTAKPPAG